jgi:hypothetical protein
MGDAPRVVVPGPMYCVNHPSVETLLRCNKCGQPICAKCRIRTPVGMRCKQCARMQRAPMYKVGVGHFLIAAVVGLPVSFIAGLIMQSLGWFGLILGAAVGGLIAAIIYRVTHKRGQGIALLTCGAIILGALLNVVLAPGFRLAALLDPRQFVNLVLRVNIFYLVTAVGAAYARLM